MMTDTEIRVKGFEILAKHLGDIEMERFIALIQREPFDYTHWRQNIDDDETIENISKKAMKLREKKRLNCDLYDLYDLYDLCGLSDLCGLCGLCGLSDLYD